MNLTGQNKQKTETSRLFEENDAEFLSKIMDLALSFTREMVSSAKPLSPESKNKLNWVNYISDFYNHGLPENRRSTKFHDTTSKRLGNLSEIEKYLGRKPTSEDFKEAFNFKIRSSGFYKGVDADIQNLLGQGKLPNRNPNPRA